MADRHFQTSKRQLEIKENLKDKKLVSSKYVVGELKNNFLKNAIAFYNLLLDEETTEDALKRLSNVLYSTRQFDRVIKLFAYLADKAFYDKGEIIERLDMLIEDGMESLFFDGLDEFINECNCIRAQAKPRREGRRWVLDMGCSQKKRPNCAIVSYIDIHTTKFEGLAQLPVIQDRDMTERLGKMCSREIIRYGTNCWKIGDAVIASEVPDDMPIYTTNKKDYEPICGFLGKVLHDE